MKNAGGSSYKFQFSRTCIYGLSYFGLERCGHTENSNFSLTSRRVINEMKKKIYCSQKYTRIILTIQPIPQLLPPGPHFKKV